MAPRSHDLLDRLLVDRAALGRRQAEADRVIAASGAAHLVHELAPGTAAKNRPWRLDPVPVVLDAPTFDRLADAVVARLGALEQILADLYGPRRLVRNAVVPAEALASSGRYRLAAVGAPPPGRWLTTYAVDVAAVADGSWRIVQDLTDTPTGVGYALLDRAVMAGVVAELLGPEGADDLASISGFPAELRGALSARTTAASPRVVVYTGGVDDPAYVEHARLARLLGFHLVEGPDLVVRRGRLWLRTLGGLDAVDVVYRRVDSARVDPIEVSATGGGGVPGLLLAASEGGVALANAHGAGVVEDPDLTSLWPAAIEALTGTGPSLATLAPGDELSRVPVFADGQVGDAAVVVRLHAVAGPDGVTVMAGGNGRVLAPGDDPRRPSAHRAKDVWVMGAQWAVPVVVTPHLPQVDWTRSVPTRAAEALFWANRAAERAEALARTARVIADRRHQDPALLSFAGGTWARRMATVLRTLREQRPDVDAPDGRPIVALDQELAAATRAVGERLAVLVAEGATVTAYLSRTATRVLGGLTRHHDTFAGGRASIDELDTAIAELAALAGLWSESTVRGPAWRFGDMGRRLERALVVVEILGACRPAGGDAGGTTDGELGILDRSALDVALAANESLIAYRRHHRSDVELAPAQELLLHDPDNPRSYAACVRCLAEHVRAEAWADGRAAVADLARIGDVRPDADALRVAHGEVESFADLLVSTWFATPVDPIVVQGRRTRAPSS